MNKREWLQAIQKADKDYYELDNPTMSDEDYDALRSEYIKAYGSKELDYVPGNVSLELKPFKHPTNINSLGKVKYFETQDIIDNVNKLKPVVMEAKVDGLTIVVYGDKFVTRGNGIEGEILPAFPKKYLSKNTSKYAIRGEAYLSKKDFEAINKERKELGLDRFANERNAAAGILRRLTNNPYLEKILFICYDVIGYDKSESEKLEYIKTHTCFPVIEKKEIDMNNITEYIEKYYSELCEYDLPIDGIVIKSNVDNSLEKFGSTTHHPLNAFAWKPEDEKKLTTLRNITWQVGRQSITPVANFDPVVIDGTTVSQASLSNYGMLRSKDLMINDTIMVEKRNKIIPFVSKMVNHNEDSVAIDKLENCPICGTKLETRKLLNTKAETTEAIELICPNESCKGKLANTIDFVFSKKCLNVKGLSIETIDKLIAMGKVSCITDMFHLTYEDFLSLDGYADKSSKDAVDSIQNCKNNVPLSIFIPACGIISISFDVGKKLENKFHTYEELLHVLKNKRMLDLIRIEGIGNITANKLISDEFIKAYENLYQYIKPIYNKTNTINKEEKTFVITGKLSQARDYYVDLLEKNGDKVVGAVSKNTFALITNDKNSDSTKANKARQLGVQVFDEQMLLDYLKG